VSEAPPSEVGGRNDDQRRTYRVNIIQIVYSMNKILFLSFLFFLLITGLSIAHADEGISATVSAEEEVIRVADVVDLTLEVRHPVGYRLIPLELEESWGEFEVRSLSTVVVSGNADGTESSRMTMAVVLWAPGTYETPPLPLKVSSPTGELSEVTAEPLLVTVGSVLAEGDGELRDIKGQATLPGPPLWPWLLGGLLGALLLGLLILGGLSLLYWFLMARNARSPRVLPDNRPPYEVALDELARIQQLNLPLQGQFKQHYSLVSDTLRHYLEKRYPISVTERTTEEIGQTLKEIGVSDHHNTMLLNLLADADLVKFSDVIPDLLDAQEFPEQARQVLLAIRPVIANPSPNSPPQNAKEVVE
ncbi:MAG: hypothetical protein ACPGWR_30120, partial [Ardenticatenaceae bacterium]